MGDESSPIALPDRKWIDAELLHIRLLSPDEVVVRNGGMRVVERVVVEMGRRYEKPLQRSGLNVPQAIFRR